MVAPASRVALLLVAAPMLAAVATVAAAAVVREDVEPHLRLDLAGHTGEIMALAFSPDSKHLFSGGRDKVAIQWRVENDADGEPAVRERNLVRQRAREGALRWQVARGRRGEIAALAVAPPVGADPSLVAVAGYGAMGTTGEIVLVDARDGGWVKTLGGATPDRVVRTGHRSAVSSLEFTSDGGWLVSQDVDGQAFAWHRAGEWQPVELAAREETRYGAAGAEALSRLPRVRPLAAVGADRVAIPELTSEPDALPPRWKVRIVDLSRPGDRGTLLPVEHQGVVRALAATPDGTRVVSSDQSGQVVVQTPGGSAPAVSWEVKPAGEKVAVTPDGRRVAVGVLLEENAQRATEIQVWDSTGPRLMASRSVANPVRALRFSPDGRWLAWSGAADRSIAMEAVSSLDRPNEGDVRDADRRRLGGVGLQVTRLAFSTQAADERLLGQPADGRPAGVRERNITRRQQPRVGPAGRHAPRRLALAHAGDGGDEPPPFDMAFDVEGLAVSPAGDAADWAPPAGRPGAWTIAPDDRPVTDRPQGLQRWQLRHEGRPAGVIDLSNEWQGPAGARGQAVSWIAAGLDAQPWAVALGADEGVFIYRLEEKAGAACPLVRWFRGNEARVVSLAVAEDGRWLASGGSDGIAMLWSLSGIDQHAALTDRWGVTLAVEEGGAVVKGVDEAGPLVGKDVAAGDVISRISFAAGKAAARTERADGPGIVATLADLPWNTQVTFVVERDGKAREFQRNPAWENVAALRVGADREWAAWTPRGYYAASANGDRSFGWLVNRGIDRVPRFFRANQFRRTLERPDVVSRLLIEGSLDAALRAAGRGVPQSSTRVLRDQMATAPEVTILSPRPGDRVKQRSTRVVAEVLVPEGAVMDRLSVSASGVAATAAPRLVADTAAEAGQPRRLRYQIDVDLPEQDRHLLNVFAATAAGPADAQHVVVESPDLPLRSRDPRIYVVAAGVDRYANAEKWQREGLGFDNLVFAVKDAAAVQDSLSRRTLGLFDIGATPLLLADASVTRDGWKAAVRTVAETVRGQVEPDDLLVLFLAGHGMTNVEAGGAYSYLCHDAELTVSTRDGEPVPSGPGAIGWDDLAPLADVPCRKLALVDTCHSGALGPAARSVAVRELQENMIVVLAAAADDQASQEADAWGHGAFTKVLLEGLEGRADVRGGGRLKGRTSGPDGIVSLDELIQYVQDEVPRLTAATSGVRQTPTASPGELVGFVAPALAKVRSDSP
ncbi:MAG: hypothetical protein ACKO4T_08015 [Planctomycetaceae bacterium]